MPHRNVTFSPLLLVGPVLRPLPTGPGRVAARAVVRRVVERAPGLAERLGDVRAVVHIQPTELPVTLVLHMRDGTVDADVRRVGEAAERGTPPDARVAAPVAVLFGLLEGEADGDALFFRRDLDIAGDTGLVMRLRYALDEAGLTGEALMDALPPLLHAPVRRLVALYRHAEGDFARFQEALLAPVQRRVDALEAARPAETPARDRRRSAS